LGESCEITLNAFVEDSFKTDMMNIGSPCIFLSSVLSTNNYAADRADQDAIAEGTAILTYDQRACRGHRDRIWQMVPGKDLAMSVLLRPRVDAKGLISLNKAIALSVCDAIAELSKTNARIKWPNDIFIGAKKCAGLLIEPSWQGQLCVRVIVGLGVNVNASRHELPETATSLSCVAKVPLKLDSVYQLICRHMNRYHSLYLDQQRGLEQSYNQRLLGVGESLPTNIGGQAMQLEGVDDMGRLVLRDSLGAVQAYQHGEVVVDYSGIVG